jgi:hypothetical protein
LRSQKRTAPILRDFAPLIYLAFGVAGFDFS